jgi:hypothetical protein
VAGEVSRAGGNPHRIIAPTDSRSRSRPGYEFPTCAERRIEATFTAFADLSLMVMLMPGMLLERFA